MPEPNELYSGTLDGGVKVDGDFVTVGNPTEEPAPKDDFSDLRARIETLEAAVTAVQRATGLHGVEPVVVKT